MFKYTYQLRLISPPFWAVPIRKGVAHAAAQSIDEGMVAHCGRACSRPSGRTNQTGRSIAFRYRRRRHPGWQSAELVRFALAHWNEGTLTQWEAGEARVAHPEVKDRNTGKNAPSVRSSTLGYGPLVFQQGTNLKNGAALQAGELNTLKLAGPESDAQALATTVTLAHWFGTIGDAAATAGVTLMKARDDTPPVAELCVATLAETGCLHPLAQCLKLDWPHAIGSTPSARWSGRGRRSFANWRDAMKFAEAKIAFRTELGFVGGQPHREPQPRHVLAYPVTNHKVPGWEGQNKGRLANSFVSSCMASPTGKPSAW